MKRALLITILFILFFGLKLYSETEEELCFDIVFTQDDPGTGNGYDWVMNGVVTCKEGDVNDCCIEEIPCEEDQKIGSWRRVDYGWLITTEIGRLKYTNVRTSEVKEFAPSGFTFSNKYYLNIIGSTLHPEYNGYSFSLEGITVDQDGKFSIFIPDL